VSHQIGARWRAFKDKEAAAGTNSSGKDAPPRGDLHVSSFLDKIYSGFDERARLLLLNQILNEDASLEDIWKRCKIMKAATNAQTLLAQVFDEDSIQALKKKAPNALKDDAQYFETYVGCGQSCKRNKKKHMAVLKDMPDMHQRIDWLSSSVSREMGFLATIVNMELTKHAASHDLQV